MVSYTPVSRYKLNRLVVGSSLLFNGAKWRSVRSRTAALYARATTLCSTSYRITFRPMAGS